MDSVAGLMIYMASIDNIFATFLAYVFKKKSKSIICKVSTFLAEYQ